MSEAGTNEQTEQPQGQRPVASFKGDGITVAVWKFKDEEKGWDRYSVKLSRSYKSDDEYVNTEYLRGEDLLRATKLLSAADDWIQNDRAKKRANAGVER